ncbi:WW domain-binding protein 11 [Cichlidogyrus casuarinus]|uniref:WW domain-binding protein 11 n=1 Tax=Cichlidogyrus casuarinus TaxID=1844966 RepID=A0ABD2QHN4_9PLAT
MGKRNLNATKSGRFMNPTDQSRKEARRRELKKNKKQRMAVRAAVLKSKDPTQLLEEAVSYDRQEYDPNVAAALNERVLQEKRKRLLETFDKLVHMYSKEDPEKYKELMNARTAYDKRRTDMMLYCEQVKLAQRVKTNDIPLPDLPPMPGASGSSLPGRGFLKVTSSTKVESSPRIKGRTPPGPPPGAPVDLSDSDSDEPSIGKQQIKFSEPLQMRNIPISGGFGNMLMPPLINPGFAMPYLMEDQVQTRIQKSVQLNYADPQTMIQSMPRTVAKTQLPQGQTQQTIEAKPKLKNLVADATRLVPTALKVRRVVKDSKGRTEAYGGVYHEGSTAHTVTSISKFGLAAHNRTQQAPVNKDDAYEEFMREMENIL